jgi:type VI secretion system secreted protein VgrG
MEYTSDGRICTVRSPFKKADELLLSHMTGQEALSTLFRFDCDLLSETAALDFDEIIGKSVTLDVKLASGELRYFSGVVSRFSQGGMQGRFTAYNAELVPWLWLLTRTSNCRIFQNKTIPQIIEEVFRDHGFKDFEMQLGSYEPRHYCVQYRETDYNFVARLMEEAGIGYYFKHGDKAHTCVLFDSPGGNAACPDQKEAVYARTAAGGEPVGDIQGWDVEREFPSGAYALTDYNFEDPSMDLMATTSSSIRVGGNEKFEIYDYPGEHQSLNTGEKTVKVRMEAEEAASIRARAQSSCAAFSPGYKFDLKGHYRKDYNVAHLLCEVTHDLTQDVGETSGEGSSYSNSIVCMPHSVPYRPLQLTPKPSINGLQTATVVGAKGQEIDVDEYGRVVVQFHWDREGKWDEKSSCRVRVSQNWAGKNWGMIFHPRIGQEVVVEFLEGDPDRPLVTGVVYNGRNKTPLELPANKTISGVKTLSSKGGAGFNELRFEDMKGEEYIFIHAEKDRHLRVKNDDIAWAGHERHWLVVENAYQKVEGEDHSTILGDQFTKVEGGGNLEVVQNLAEKVGGDYGLDVKGAHAQKAAMDYAAEAGKNIHIKGGMNVVVEAGAQLTIKAGGAFVTLGPAGVDISGAMVKINSGGAAGAGSGASPVPPSLPEDVLIAMEGKPGEVTEPPEWKRVEPSEYTPQAQALSSAASEGAPFCEH